jgi:phage terminase small subunit
MGRRGPKPMPKALRLLRGPAPTVSRTTASVARTERPAMPDGLSELEQACWLALMTELETVPGLVSRADRGVCELAARLEPAMRAAAVVVREKGSTIECRDRDGNIKFIQQRAEATFLLKTAATLKGLYAELGLSPSGRSRVSVTPAAPTSKLDRFLSERHGA